MSRHFLRPSNHIKNPLLLNKLLILSLELEMGISIVNVIEAMLSDYSKLGPLQTVVYKPTTRRQVHEDQAVV